MKILEIKLKNLNSLRGEWTIDLTDSAYKSDGIFAVTGSTGAGKTTIFDALSLALYGQTPRLARINASSNEIMSRGTSECFAHVKFSTEEGIFVCKWWQTRTGGRPKGALQSANHHIEKYVEGQKEGEPLATQHTLTLNEVKRITGMDFAQFTQSVLLAQGKFDAFLNGTASARAKILELLTGTGIYSEISTKIALRTGIEENKLNAAKLKRDSTIPRDGLGTDEEISQNIDKTQALLKSAEESFRKSKEELDWLNLIRRIKDELSRNQSAIEAQKSAVEKFSQDRARLEAGLRAKNVLPIYSELSAKRKQYAKDK
ncbi:MAG: AAA family ATPase, partial [Synergistaceae bacterium]|nr:AAA family ATPase [Synergistaceae bacterium]